MNPWPTVPQPISPILYDFMMCLPGANECGREPSFMVCQGEGRSQKLGGQYT